MKSRSLGLVFVAAVIIPSTALAVLSIRAAGREEAFVERQIATTLDVETSRAADLATEEVARIVEELGAGIDIPAGSAYAAVLRRWKTRTPLVDVPFLVSPRLGILWPTSGPQSGAAERKFLQQHGDFLSDRTGTTVLQNIADRYRQEILSQAAPADAATVGAAPAEAEPAAAAPVDAAPVEAASRQKALDAFAQSPAIQSEVYAAAAEKGDQLSSRVAQPVSRAASNAPAIASSAGAAPPAAAPGTATPAAAALVAAPATVPAAMPPAPKKQAAVKLEQPSQYVVTSQLLSQIASAGNAGIIPRFTNDGLVFLFWERQADGRIAGCGISGSLFRARIASVLEATATASRILTFLDENGAPLAAPPGDTGRDWSRPFVSREIGAALPRWEAAAYLTHPDVISAQARASSLVIWVMVLILFVSVAGGGAMVLSSVYGEMRLARKKATFVTNVSHELKTPLTSISLFVELLRRKRPLAAEKRDSYLAQVASETERLTRLINNVLDFSALTARPGGDPRAAGGRGGSARGAGGRRGAAGRGMRYAMEVVDAREVAEQVLEGQRVRLESLGFTVSNAPSIAACDVRADPGALKQVLLNLISNAEKYSRERREVSIRVERSEAGVLIHVLDRGIGVAEKERERIFKEFYRVDDTLSSRVQGTGLGLTIARRIARDHGGDVVCEARDGGGSDFIVRLPARGGEEGT